MQHMCIRITLRFVYGISFFYSIFQNIQIYKCIIIIIIELQGRFLFRHDYSTTNAPINTTLLRSL